MKACTNIVVFNLVETTYFNIHRMRFFTTITAALFFCNGLIAQIQKSANTETAWNCLVNLSKHSGAIKPEQYSGYPVYMVRNELHVSLMGRIKSSPNWSALLSQGVIRGSVLGKVATIKVPLSVFSSVPYEDVFEYIEVPGLVSPHLDRAVKATHTDSVHQGINLPQEYSGENVLIGVTDWGFDYTHPMFYDTLLQHTRIVSAWDQFKQLGTPPSGYNYGAEYNGETALFAAQGDTANIYSFGTHGTHVAGIAGGSGAGIAYRGMAPAAGFLFATFLIDAASVIDAFVWMKDKAIEEDKRLVINMSWGLYYMGTLDGTSLLSQAIDGLSEEGVVFITSAGNNGSDGFHIKKTFDNDMMTTRVRFDNYANPNLWGQSITMWGEPFKAFEAKIGVYSNGGVLLVEAPFYATATSATYTVDTLVTNTNDSIFYNVTVDAQHPLNNRPHIRLRVKCTNPNLRVGLTAQAIDGTVHFWNVVELTNGVGNWGMQFTGFGAAAVAGDSNYSISEPACAESLVAVAAYSSEYMSGGSPVGGQIANFTSIGPLITEVMKPDIAAPGVSVASSISSFTDASYGPVASVAFNGTDYDFARFSGTSMASPCVAGIVALMLQADPTLTPQEIKEVLHSTARLDNFTGVITAPGHVRWGYGKVNAYKAVKSVAPTVGINELKVLSTVGLMPNPANDYFNLKLNPKDKIQSVRAMSVDGKSVQLSVEQNRVNCASLASGIYVIEIITSDFIGHSTLMKL